MRKFPAVHFFVFSVFFQLATQAQWTATSIAGPLPDTPYFSTKAVSVAADVRLTRSVIGSPPVPPPGYDIDRSSVYLPITDRQMGVVTLSAPAYSWFFGCSATSGAMIAGYYDRNGYKNIYTGPANNGVAPLDNDYWPTWTDRYGGSYDQCPLTASRYGLDGRTTRGSIDDYWVEYNSVSEDPYLAGNWKEHAWGSAIGDYMKTSQSAYGNPDGSTAFYTYTDSPNELSCGEMAGYGIGDDDGTYGRKLFYEARGYTVTECYSQRTDNTVSGGFSYAQYKSEIDAGRPVMLNLEGHTVVGVGYSDTSSTIYIHDTWDNQTHTMPWGGSYSGMALWGVSIVNLETLAVPSAATLPATGITRSSAVLNGTVNPNGSATSCYFEWGSTTDYGKTTPVQPAGSGTVSVEISHELTSLSPNMTYHCRLVATNGSSTTYGKDIPFETQSFVTPVAITQGAIDIKRYSATLSGTVNPRELPTTYYFQWGETAGYGRTTPVRSAGEGAGDLEVSEAITGIYPNRTYHFRLVAINSAGTTPGSDRTFHTAAVVVEPLILLLTGN